MGGFGSFSAGLDNFAEVAQSFATIQGGSYLLSFELAHDTSSDPAVVPDNVFGAFQNLNLLPTTEELNVANLSYRLVTASFIATSANTTLAFEAEDANFVFSVDDISVTAIPEASNLLLGIAGLGAMLLFAQRRKTRPKRR
jgi:hypothetical protein